MFKMVYGLIMGVNLRDEPNKSDFLLQYESKTLKNIQFKFNVTVTVHQLEFVYNIDITDAIQSIGPQNVSVNINELNVITYQEVKIIQSNESLDVIQSCNDNNSSALVRVDISCQIPAIVGEETDCSILIERPWQYATWYIEYNQQFIYVDNFTGKTDLQNGYLQKKFFCLFFCYLLFVQIQIRYKLDRTNRFHMRRRHTFS